MYQVDRNNYAARQGGAPSTQDFAQVLLSLPSTAVLSGGGTPKGPSLVLHHLLSSVATVPPKEPEVAPEITRPRFLHPFLIAAGCNDALWKINT